MRFAYNPLQRPPNMDFRSFLAGKSEFVGIRILRICGIFRISLPPSRAFRRKMIADRALIR